MYIYELFIQQAVLAGTCASVCVHKCLCVFVCVRVHICKWVCVCACVCMHVCVCTCVHMCERMRVCACVHERMCVFTCVCMCMCMSVCVCVRVCVCMYQVVSNKGASRSQGGSSHNSMQVPSTLFFLIFIYVYVCIHRYVQQQLCIIHVSFFQ